MWPLVMIVILPRRPAPAARDRPVADRHLDRDHDRDRACSSTTASTTTNTGEFPAAYVEIFGRTIDKNNFLYLGTISRSSGILLGAGFAMLWRPLAVLPRRRCARPRPCPRPVGARRPRRARRLMFTYELTQPDSAARTTAAVPRRLPAHRPVHAAADRRRHPSGGDHSSDGSSATRCSTGSARARTGCTSTTGRSTRSSASRRASR